MRLLRRAARERYALLGLDDASQALMRRAAHGINAARLGAGEATAEVHAGELGALLVLQDLLSGLVDGDGDRAADGVLAGVLDRLDGELGHEAVDELLDAFAAEFDFAAADEPGGGESPPERRRLRALAALVVLWQLNRNPAIEPFRELIDDRLLAPALYQPAMRIVETELRRPGSKGGDLIERLEAPARAAPSSIGGQLRFFLEDRPEAAVPRERLERALDAIEEERPRGPAGPGPVELPPPEPALAPSPPRDEPEWMRELVLTAKHTHVWLAQLSARLERPIETLDEVPDEALAELAAGGTNGLWLVGIWERSRASKTIKRLSGNASAESSAYSIFDYRVAPELGGEEALAGLGERALEHGIRLGVDVVPNHFGIDSRWLRDHPERFLSVAECPFPSYTFDGPDLSGSPDVGIYLEDHYYDQSDAAVVFRHVDRRTGRERFIYHGNDGTGTPWNDTAQLDYTQPAVRAAMGEVILDLARRFRILRFDAAMTLTQMHFQRLWFPAAGSGGAVPSRSEHGMSSEHFARLMPNEFWRDVVEQVDTEAPDTLLIAEAFWLMEPYFVRELGMHRVYNSAFMHLLRERDNERWQRLVRDILARDPELLRRSVNFMSTPDEESTAVQFGTGDRYFGVLTLLAALPGLPLLGHGQVEGLAEKYGMEYREPRTSETPDDEMSARHRREILPLLAERGEFSRLEHFYLLDATDGDGRPLPEVSAVVSGRGRKVWLVVFNNSEREVGVRLHNSLAAGGLAAGTKAATLAALLDVEDEAETLTLRDPRDESEITCRTVELVERGLELELGAWGTNVLRRC